MDQLPTSEPPQGSSDGPGWPLVIEASLELGSWRLVFCSSGMSDFKHFFGVAPSAQNALDLFAGEWSSQPAAGSAGAEGGRDALFADPRIYVGASPSDGDGDPKAAWPGAMCLSSAR